jgi:L,D-transpeptidase-like protein/putative peptidoglycan binding protein/PKD domain-containing protein
VRRAAILVAALAFAPAAHAAPPAVSAQAAPTTGAAPLHVTLTAGGNAATYQWDLGDGATADGSAVEHVYGAGRFVAHVTATAPSGETAQAQVTITALGLTLAAPRTAGYHRLRRFHGRLVPGLKGVRVALYRGDGRIATSKTRRNGRFSLRGRIGAPDQAYTVRSNGAVSSPVTLAVRPGLDTAFLGSGQLGRRLVLTARVRPADAGVLTARVWRGHRQLAVRTAHGRLRMRLDTRRSVAYRVLVTVAPSRGYLATRRLLRQTVYLPALHSGDAGPSVYALEQRLSELHFALGRVDGYYGVDTSDAVVAFQKLHGLPRTGSVDPRFWRELDRAHIPAPRYGGTHVEVSKERQVLFLVHDGVVRLTVPVSTGATGNTPVGLWHVYSKVPGYNAKEMYYSSFFIGGFAIHGYHSVPSYPASHGCVRIPLWIAQRVYSLTHYGTTVYIY